MERLSRLIPRRRSARSPAAPRAAAAEPHVSVLDIGSASIKAIVIATEGARPRVLAYTAEALPTQADEAALLRASERALVRAEDGAGVVPHQMAASVRAAVCVIAQSEKEAQQRVLAERAAAAALSLVSDGVYAYASDVELLRRLVTALDLDLLGLVAVPTALATVLHDGLIVDVGGTHTGVVVARDGRVAGAIALPIGGGALEERLRDRLGLGEVEARQAVAAHAAGAGHRSSAGLAAARTIEELARHHADVWLDGLETALEELGRGQSLPSAVGLCGGGSLLPELRAALSGHAWRAALLFEAEPRIEIVRASEIEAVEMPVGVAAGTEAVSSVCVAAAAVMGR